MINVTHLNLMSLNTLGILLPIIAIIGSIFTLYIQLNLYCIYSLVLINLKLCQNKRMNLQF